MKFFVSFIVSLLWVIIGVVVTYGILFLSIMLYVLSSKEIVDAILVLVVVACILTPFFMKDDE